MRVIKKYFMSHSRCSEKVLEKVSVLSEIFCLSRSPIVSERMKCEKYILKVETSQARWCVKIIRWVETAEIQTLKISRLYLTLAVYYSTLLLLIKCRFYHILLSSLYSDVDSDFFASFLSLPHSLAGKWDKRILFFYSQSDLLRQVSH